MKYLYGAAVQGIQQFIFQTNELKNIVEASERVQNICTELFARLLYGFDAPIKDLVERLKTDDCAVINAAGNIKYIFNEREECERVVRQFPKAVMEYAPGITISQSVVPCADDSNYVEYSDELERRLRQQRNKPTSSITTGMMGIKREAETNLPVLAGLERIDVKNSKTELCRNAFGDNINMREVVWEIEKMTGKNDWIAVIHADGNGLGQVVQKIGKNRAEFKDFSRNLDAATKAAAQSAFEAVSVKLDEEKKKMEIPIRPIVLGGDDLTVICRADLAMDYATAFMDAFEKEAEEKTHQKLTACAGIAYIKSSFPFYYGYALAESLCSEAKKDAKKDLREGEFASSCLMFHKVQDSFTEDYASIVERELVGKDGYTMKFGPYYLHKIHAEQKGRWTIETLKTKTDFFEKQGKDGSAIKTHLRRWLTDLHQNTGMAHQKVLRMKSLFESQKDYIESVTTGLCTPAYDILALHTINTQETKD